MPTNSGAAPTPRSHRNGRRAQQAREGLYRDLILAAAARTFAERGVEAARMEEVAAAAGLSLGTVYSVFRGKAAIVDALHERRLGEVRERAAEVARGISDPLQSLIAGVRAYVTYFLANPDYLRMYLADGQSWGTGSGQPQPSPRATAWQEGIAAQARSFERGVAAGVFYPGNPDRMARTLVAMQQVRLADWLADGRSDDAETVIGEMELQLRRAFCKRPADRGDGLRVPRANRGGRGATVRARK
jgi:AcrR family transcriptional regulator